MERSALSVSETRAPGIAVRRPHAVVIGAGLGGLATALRLAKRNWHVTLCENAHTVGGKMNLWESSGFRFDTGPSLITMPWVFEELFEDIGESLHDHIELVPVDPLMRYVFPDGRIIDWPNQPDALEDVIRAIDDRDVAGWRAFMRMGEQLFNLSKETFLEHPVGHTPPWSSLGVFCRTPWRHFTMRYGHLVNAYFKSPYLRRIMNRYPTYVGSSPYHAPAMLGVIPYIENTFGGWHIRGGLYTLIEVLGRLARQRGVQIRLNTRVDAIAMRSRRVHSVRLANGQHLEADIVVMNGDTANIMSMIKSSRPLSTPRHMRSLSGFVIMAGVRGNLENVPHHAVYFSDDYETEFDSLFEKGRFPGDPTVYMCTPSRTDHSVAPAACESVFIMANAPSNPGARWQADQIECAKARIMDRLSKGGFANIDHRTITSRIMTPRDIADTYLMPGGAIYGEASHGIRRSFLRPPNRSRACQGLYCVGGSAHPGGGTPSVVLSSKIAVEEITRHERRPHHEMA